MDMPLVLLIALTAALLTALPAAGQGADPSAQTFSWNAPDRAAKVADLTPGGKIPEYTPQNLFADYTAAKVEAWQAEHPDWEVGQACAQYATQDPTDESIIADFPRHISPSGRVRSGDAGESKAEEVLHSYRPFCGSVSMSIAYDQQNPYHGTTTCCGTELYGREQDFPPDCALKPTATVKFLHLDDTWVEVPCTVYRDKQGVEWELFIKTIFDQKRWIDLQTTHDQRRAQGGNGDHQIAGRETTHHETSHTLHPRLPHACRHLRRGAHHPHRPGRGRPQCVPR